MNNKKIAIFASGSGTNAENIIRYFRSQDQACSFMIFSNKKDSGVLARAESLGVPYLVFDRDDFYSNSKIISILESFGTDLIILAGFLWLVPPGLIDRYQGRIINIHPALLPQYGGKGMYGSHVHKAVIEAGDKESGISIHLVNPEYDEGDIIFQARCEVLPGDTPETLAERIHQLEYEHYPRVVMELLLSLE